MSLLPRIIVVVSFLVFAARAQETVPLFPKGEIFVTDSLVTIGRSARYLVQHGDYILFDVAVNDTLGMIIIYKKDSASGEYSEVNRIQGTVLLADGMTSNGEWLMTYDGMTREVNFFKLNADHQVVNKVKWSYNSLTIWHQSFRLMPDNNFVTVDFVYANLKVLIYKYSANDWSGTSVFSMPTPTAEVTYLTDTGLVILDPTNSVVSLYDYHGDNFTFAENITVPFQLKKNGRNAFAYDGNNTLVFVNSVTEVAFVERSQVSEGWEVSLVYWNMTQSTIPTRSYLAFHSGKVYIGNREYNKGDPLQGAIFEFTKSDLNWTNTAIYRPYSPIINEDGFQTNAALGFTITDDAVFSLGHSFDSNNIASHAAYQMQYVILSCYDEALEITCQGRTVSCDTTSIVAADLVTVTEPCGDVSVTSNDKSTIALDFSGTTTISATLTAFRFGATAQCEVTIQCSNDVTPAGSPIKSPSVGTTPSTIITSDAASLRVILSALVLSLVVLLQ
jgi:hypothetical protein